MLLQLKNSFETMVFHLAFITVSLLLITPSSAQEISIERHEDHPLVDGGGKENDGYVHFERAALGSAGFGATLTIKNEGTEDLTGISVDVVGDNSGDYTLDLVGMDTTVAPNASTTFSVHFIPGGVGDRFADLQVTSNDADESPFDILLRGRGVSHPPVVLVVDSADRDSDGTSTPGNMDLREAMELANSHEDANTILFHDSLDGVALGTDSERDEIRIRRPVTIQGNGARNTVIDGSNQSGILSIQTEDDQPLFDVNILDITFRDALDQYNGGAIYNGANLTIERCSFLNNRTDGSDHPTGGAIFSFAGTLTVKDSTFSGNSTSGRGGAIFVGNNGSFSAINSTFDNNTAAEGGAIYNQETSTIFHCAVTANNATQADGGGGIRNENSGSTMAVLSSIVAGNTASGTASDLTGAGFSGEFSLIGDADSAGGLTNGTDNNIVGNAGVGILALSTIVDDLANNGGQTDTRALASGSPAINAGSNSAVDLPALDQRQHSSRISDTTVDIGPFEVGALPAPQEISVQHPVGTDLTSGTETITFPLAAVAGTQVVTFSIKNEGGADLTGIGVSKSGADQAEFTIDTGSMATTLRNLERTTFSVTFAPSSVGTKNASIAIASNDGDENPFNIDLTGVAVSTPSVVLRVDNNSDVSDLNFSAGELTLREAIQLSNLLPDHNAVSFDAALPAGTPISLTEPLDTIIQPVTISGSGATATIIDAQNNGRIFDFGAVEATLVGMTLRNGLSPESENGGAINGESTSLTVRECEITDNATQGEGGQGSPFGGGIYLSTGSTLLMENSTVANNSTTSIAGGILCFGDATFRNCTISGNTAVSGNGGVATAGGKAVYLNCTVVENVSTGDFGFGGILNFDGTLKLDNSIVAGNTEGGMDVDVISIKNNSQGVRVNVKATGRNNLIGNADSAAGFTNGTRNIVGDGGTGTLSLATVIGPLQDNGGETRTRALIENSPAINKGSNSTISVLADRDQRNFSRVSDGTVDVGAYEAGGIIQDEGAPALTLKTLKNLLVLEDSTVVFENLFPGQTKTETFKVVNDGTTPLSFTSSSSSGDFAVVGEGSLIDPKKSVNITITFSPTTEGDKSGVITLSDNSGQDFTLNVAGRCIVQTLTREVDRDAGTETDVVVTTVTYDTNDNGAAQVGNYYGLLRTDDPGDDLITLAGYGTAKISHSKSKNTGSASVVFFYDRIKYSVKGALDANGLFTANFTKKVGSTRVPMTATGQLGDTADGEKVLTLTLTGDGTPPVFVLQKRTSNNFALPKATAYLPADLAAVHTDEPGGDGVGTVKGGRLGTAKVAFRLGDGTKTSTVLYELDSGLVMFHRNLYSRNAIGSIGGVLESKGESLYSSSIYENPVHWEKNEESREKLYPLGFDLQQNMILSEYRRPLSRAKERVLTELPNEASNAVINFQGGNTAAVEGKRLTWDSRNKIKHISETKNEKLTVAVSTSTGLVTGRYRNKEQGQDLRFSGVAVQDQGFVVGHFVGDGETGRILIDAAGLPALTVETAADNGALANNATLDFGQIGIVGGISEIGIRLSNTGLGTLRIGEVSAPTSDSVSDAEIFILSSSRIGSIPPGGQTIIRLRFDPDAVTTFNGGINIYSNDPSTPTFTLNLTGEGIAGTDSDGREVITDQNSVTMTAADFDSTRSSAVAIYDTEIFPGSYYGMLVDENNGSNIGYISIKITNSRDDIGVASGKIRLLDRDNLTFKGSFDGAGAYTGTLKGKISDTFTALVMNLHSVENSLEPQIVGNLDNYSFVAGISRWHSRNNPFTQPGRFSILIPNNDNLQSGYPGGAGAGSMTVSTTGTAKMSTFLADGKRFTWSGKVNESSQLQIYKGDKTSRISSLMTFRDIAVSDIDGIFSWERHPNARSPYYPHGFKVDRVIMGCLYTKPAKGAHALSDLDGIASPNATTLLDGFGLDETFSVDWGANNKIIYTPERTERVVTTLSTTTGRVSGYWWDRGVTNIRYRFRGVAFQKQQLVAGYWYYKDGETGLYQLLPNLP